MEKQIETILKYVLILAFVLGFGTANAASTSQPFQNKWELHQQSVPSVSQESGSLAKSRPNSTAARSDVNLKSNRESNNKSTPSVQFSGTASSGAESVTSPTITVTLSSASSRTITVVYSVTGGSASSSSDYSFPSGKLTFSPGETSKNVPLTIANDTITESDETVRISLSNPSNANLGNNTSFTYTIVNDDITLPTVQFQGASSSALESVASPAITVTLSAASTQTATVNYAVVGGTATTADYSLPAGTLSFAPGQTSATLPLSIVNDTSDETDETIMIQLNSAVNANLGSPTLCTYTILNDDAALPTAQFQSASASGSESVASPAVTVVLSKAPTQTVTVNYVVTGGTATSADFTLAAGTLSFAAGQTSRMLPLTIIDDSVVESSETIQIALSGAVNANLGSPSLFTYTIQDNDTAAPPTVQFQGASASGAENVTSPAITVTLSAASTQTVSVNYAVTGGTATSADFTMAAGTLNFAAGQTSKTLPLTIVDDSVVELSESIQITLSGAANATLGSPSLFTYTIQDNDVALPTVQFSAASSSGAESVTAPAINVTLSAASPQTVTVNYTVTGDTATSADYSLAAGTLSFTAGQTSKALPLSIVNDSLVESNETVVIALSAPSNATLGGTTVYTYTIQNDDTLPTVQFQTASVVGLESVASPAVSVSLSAASAQSVTVNYAVSGGTASTPSDYTLPAGTLTFTAGQTVKMLPLTIVDDSAVESDETIVVSLSAPSNATLGSLSGATYTIKDNDTAAPTGLSTTIHVGSTPVQTNLRRLGVNLGAPTGYGAGQMMKNLIENPGFEPGQYATVFHVMSGATGTRLAQDFWDTSWNNDTYGIGQPAGFWNGADYEVVYGPAKGRTGHVSNFTLENSRYTWYLDSNGTAPQNWDVVFAHKDFPGSYYGWQPSGDIDMTTKRPGTNGTQSFHAVFPGNSWTAVYQNFFDSQWRDDDPTAGKMLIVEGQWTFSVWAKGKKSGDQLHVSFYREGEATFLDQTFTLTTSWQQYTVTAQVPANADKIGPYSASAYHPILGLGCYIPNSGGEVWLDDVSLSRTGDSNPTAFTDNVVNRLKELHPGVVRDWRIQFGSTLDNELADPTARKTTGYRPHERAAKTYGYSLPEFLGLCKEVGAEPWYVFPPTFTPTEVQNLIAYLAAPVSSGNPYAALRAAQGQSAPWTSVFPKIHLEYGNELWGSASGSDPFWGASHLGGVRVGAVANDTFATMRQSSYFAAGSFDLIIGGQAAWSGRQTEIQGASTKHDSLALAPYFGYLDSYANDSQIFSPLYGQTFAETTTGTMKQSYDIIKNSGQSTKMAIYEINFDTIGGAAPIDARNNFVTSQAGGVALPLFMLNYQKNFGAQSQCAFTMAQYSFLMNGEHPRVWGLLHDLGSTGRKRPTWLALEAVNQAVLSNMVATTQDGTNPSVTAPGVNELSSSITYSAVTPFAYSEGTARSLVLFNLSLTDAQPVTIDTAELPLASATKYEMFSTDPHATNEDAENVTLTSASISDFRDQYPLTIQPHSITVITWTAGA